MPQPKKPPAHVPPQFQGKPRKVTTMEQARVDRDQASQARTAAVV
jgi:hypothetical protein